MRHRMKLPLKDGDTFIARDGRIELVMGPIKLKARSPVCWTLRGNWYRRSDGVQMTGWNGQVMTVKKFKKFYERRRKGKL